MNDVCNLISRLPDIEIYGGETTPWNVSFYAPDGSAISVLSANDYVCTLTLLPFKYSMGLAGTSVVVPPILKKSGAAWLDAQTSNLFAVFDFSAEDTLGLRGKFTYQIDVKSGDDVSIGQGTVFIRSNINR